jgi:hypothetical protein
VLHSTHGCLRRCASNSRRTPPVSTEDTTAAGMSLTCPRLHIIRQPATERNRADAPSIWSQTTFASGLQRFARCRAQILLESSRHVHRSARTAGRYDRQCFRAGHPLVSLGPWWPARRYRPRLEHLERAVTVALSPLDYSDPAAWATALTATLCSLANADAGAFLLPGAAPSWRMVPRDSTRTRRGHRASMPRRCHDLVQWRAR